MTASLETFAKVRALHDRTDSPGEKAAAARRMDALARTAGMTTAEAVSKLDRSAAHAETGADWSAFADAFWKAEKGKGAAANAPEALSRRRGLPIYDPNKIECWRDVAEHCLQLDWLFPKAHGGRFLTKEQRERLKVIARQYCHITNATADWMEAVLNQCEAARQARRDRGKDGARPARKVAETDIEKAAELIAAARLREASKMDTPEPEEEVEPKTQAQAAADALNAFFNRPEFVAERNEREARRRVEAAAIIERYGAEDAVFDDTPLEAALRAACEPLIGPGETWNTSYSLDGWGSLGTRATMPANVRETVSQGWPLPATVAEAWAEFEAADRLMGERCTVQDAYEPHLYVEARRYVIEEICNTLPARSLDDLRARGAWLAFQADSEVSQDPAEHRTLIATLRADIERMGVQFGQVGTSGERHTTSAEGGAVMTHPSHAADAMDTSLPVQSGQAEGSVSNTHPLRRTNADKRRDVLALIQRDVGKSDTAPLTDREIARRAGVSPSTVAAVRRSLA